MRSNPEFRRARTTAVDQHGRSSDDDPATRRMDRIGPTETKL
jgi:hypothetical protein